MKDPDTRMHESSLLLAQVQSDEDGMCYIYNLNSMEGVLVAYLSR